MSTRRTAQSAGWVDLKALPRGPGGRALCRQCQEEVPKGRRSFCSDECVNTWRLKTDPAHVRRMVFARDRGICKLCGLNTEQLLSAYYRIVNDRQAARDFLKAYGIPAHRTSSFWDADHILPVIEGGGECDLDNYRTLCIPCHKKVTAELRARMAERNRPQVQERQRARSRSANGPGPRTPGSSEPDSRG